MNSFRFSVLFVVVFICILVCLIVFIMFNQLFLFISSNCSFNVHANINASGSHSMNKKSDSGFRPDRAILPQAPINPKDVKRHRGELGVRIQISRPY